MSGYAKNTALQFIANDRANISDNHEMVVCGEAAQPILIALPADGRFPGFPKGEA